MSSGQSENLLVADLPSKSLLAFGKSYPLAFGKGGYIAETEKREGDGKSPLGCYDLQGVLLRPDRIAPVDCQLPWRWIRPNDGWSDDAHDPCYNRPVSHPRAFSAERLWREDKAYDVVIVLNHNQNPPVSGKGSAIFWHLAQPGFSPTEGCIAIEKEAMLEILPRLAPGMMLEIRG